jgi:hypothetical protein
LSKQIHTHFEDTTLQQVVIAADGGDDDDDDELGSSIFVSVIFALRDFGFFFTDTPI